MKGHECEFEADVMLAVQQGRWPEEIRGHVAGCEGCRELTAVALAFEGARADTLERVTLPDSGRVWRQAQLRARKEAVEAAGRPITAVQVIAFGAAMSLLGACFGATSAWFQGGVKWAASGWAGIDKAAWLAAASKLLAEHGALVVGTAAAVILLPTVVLVAMGRD